jgi:N-carbamoyl-L-amino-acid hydrolase
MTNLQPRLDRMQEVLARLSAPDVGGTPGGGVSRPALSDADRNVRLRFQDMMSNLGLVTRFDDLGSMYGRRQGGDGELAPVLVGSHLDTVVPGGRFDGILGVTAALEAVAVLNESRVQTVRPIEVVNWTAEEGARFSPAMLASGVIAGVHDAEFVYGRSDLEGRRFGDELERIGFRGDRDNRPREIYASLEMHIEQGTRLEETGVPVGIVSGIDPVRWFSVSVTGRGEHAGGPGPRNRRDAMVAASRMIAAARDRSLFDGNFKTTVGIIKAYPGSTNVVPANVTFTLDVRAATDEALAGAVDAVLTLCREIAVEERVAVSCEPTFRLGWTQFDPHVRSIVRRAAQRLGIPASEIRGGIGHDSMHLAAVTRAGMLFTPTVAGLSHCESEDSPWDAILAATAVLIEALVELANER